VFRAGNTRGIWRGRTLLAIGGLLWRNLYRGTYGLLIPGGILLGLGLGSIAERAMPASVDFDAMALALAPGHHVIALVYAADPTGAVNSR